VVHLGVDGELAGREPVDHGELPQRPGAIERLLVEHGDQRLELGHRAGRRHGRAANVMVEIDVLVLDPERAIEVERHAHDPGVQERHERQAPGDRRLVLRKEVAAVALRQVDQAQATDVRRRLRRLAVQKDRVLIGQLLQHAGPPPLDPVEECAIGLASGPGPRV